MDYANKIKAFNPSNGSISFYVKKKLHALVFVFEHQTVNCSSLKIAFNIKR